MTRKHITAVGGGRRTTENKTHQIKSEQQVCSLSLYFTDYTSRFKQVSRDGESDPALKSHQRSARVTETRALLEFREFAARIKAEEDLTEEEIR